MRHRLRAFATIAGLILLGAGAGATGAQAAGARPVPAQWTQLQAGPHHNAVFAGSSTPHSWSFLTGNIIVSGLSLVGHTLYAESFDHNLYALDARTGREKWHFQAGNIIMTAPIVADGLVVIGSGINDVAVATPTRTVWARPQGDAVYAVDAATGRLRWIHRTVGEDMPTPALVDGRLVFSNGDDVVQALALKTGAELWRLPVQGVGTMASSAARGTRVFLVTGESPTSAVKPPVYTYAVDAITGKMLWKAPYGDADSSPTLGGGLVFVEGSETLKGVTGPDNTVNTVDALSQATGRKVWGLTSPRGQLITVGEQAVSGTYVNGVLYQSLPEAQEFAAIDARTGKVLWMVRTHAPAKTAPVVWQGRVLVGDTLGYFYAIDARTGRILVVKRFPKGFNESVTIVAGATIYLANGDTVYAMPVTRLAGPGA